MKTTLLALAMASAGLLAAPFAAHAQDNGGFFINGNVGQASLDEGMYDDEDTAYGVNLGYRWSVSPGFAIGVEGGYVDLGKYAPKSNIVLPVGQFLGDAELDGFTAGVNGRFNLGDNWYISGRTGLFRADVKGDYLAAGIPTRVDDTSNKWYAGAGFGYDFSNNFSVGLNFDHYEVDKRNLDLNSNLISVSAEARF